MFGNRGHFKRIIVFITLIMIFTIAFETAQQLYYINRYNIVEGVTFLELLKGQSYRWLLWAVLGFFLFTYIKHTRTATNTTPYYLKLAFYILGLVLLNAILISLLQMGLN